MNFYPNTLPKFLQNSYSLKRSPSVIRTTMTNGTVRQRLLSVDAPHTLSVNLQFNNIVDYQTWLFRNSIGACYKISMTLDVDNVEFDQAWSEYYA